MEDPHAPLLGGIMAWFFLLATLTTPSAAAVAVDADTPAAHSDIDRRLPHRLH